MHKRMMGVLAGLTTAGLVALATPASANTATLFSPNPVDGWGNDGTTYAVAIASNAGIVFAGGSFLNAVKHNQPPQPRHNLMAVSEATGNVLLTCEPSPPPTPCFSASTDGAVRAMAMATDGTSLYIGGDFTMVNGQPRTRIARLDLSGNLLPLDVRAPKTVRDMAVVGNTLYVVGDFGTVTGRTPPGVVTRKRAAAFDVNTGEVLPFNPVLSGKANAIAISGSTAYLGGAFLTVRGQAHSYLAAVNLSDGAPLPIDFQQVVDVILDVSVTGDYGGRVFAAGGGSFNSAAAWDLTPQFLGQRLWRQRANGDVQAVKYVDGNLYFGFHDGFAGNVKLRLLAADGGSGDLEQTFAPISAGYPGTLVIDADASHLVVAGKFPKMGTRQVKGLSIHPR